MHSLTTSASRRRLRFAMAGLAVFFATASVSKPPIPAPNLQAAQQAIANAERVDAATHAAARLSPGPPGPHRARGAGFRCAASTSWMIG